jgi:8-oxo-dGTP diphosphatase
MSDKPFRLAVKALVRDRQGKILLIRRSQQSGQFKGKWDLPGGKVDAGESFDEGLRREVAEETGVEVSVDALAGSLELETPGARLAVLVMECRHLSGEVRLSAEHDAYAWVPREELPNMEFGGRLRSFIESYKQQSQSVPPEGERT